MPQKESSAPASQTQRATINAVELYQSQKQASNIQTHQAQKREQPKRAAGPISPTRKPAKLRRRGGILPEIRQIMLENDKLRADNAILKNRVKILEQSNRDLRSQIGTVTRNER